MEESKPIAAHSRRNTVGRVTSERSAARQASTELPVVSIVLPAHNEANILIANLTSLCDYLDSLRDQYCFEIVLVNDGSTDDTGRLAEEFSELRDDVRVLHHRHNFGLGQALQYAFRNCRGDYIAVLDIDLSYAPEHIGRLLETIRETGAKLVAASPYMAGGGLSAVPWFRRTLSIWANRFLSMAARGNLSTLTGMVRVYDKRFIQGINVRSMGAEINPELVYKAMLLNGRIAEIPGHLDWSLQRSHETRRRSSLPLLRQMIAVLLSGFLFRPVAFFIVPGLAVACLGLYTSAWTIAHFVRNYQLLAEYSWIPDRAGYAVAAAFEQFPHTFIVAGLSTMLAIQLIGLGILCLQSKSYFEELFHLGSTVYRTIRSDPGKETGLSDQNKA